MGCDIHTRAQRKVGEQWETLEFEPFNWRSYGMFGFLAGVRNLSGITPISEPRGVPADVSPDFWEGFEDLHSASWLSVAELAAFDYDQIIEDRRGRKDYPEGRGSYAVTLEPGQGETMSLRDFLDQAFFDDIAKLQEIGAERVIFGFDS